MTRDEKLQLYGPGPWLDEDDEAEFETSGYPCAMVRNKPTGTWCGYAGVPAGHPWHGKEVDTMVERPPGWGDWELDERVPIVAMFLHPPTDGELIRLDLAIRVHGGITFVAPQRGRIRGPQLKAPPEVWWFGFDCSHAGDLCPTFLRAFGAHPPSWVEEMGLYRTQDYAVGETCRLAAQLRNVELRHFAERGN